MTKLNTITRRDLEEKVGYYLDETTLCEEEIIDKVAGELGVSRERVGIIINKMTD